MAGWLSVSEVSLGDQQRRTGDNFNSSDQHQPPADLLQETIPTAADLTSGVFTSSASGSDQPSSDSSSVEQTFAGPTADV